MNHDLGLLAYVPVAQGHCTRLEAGKAATPAAQRQQVRESAAEDNVFASKSWTFESAYVTCLDLLYHDFKPGKRKAFCISGSYLL